MSEDSFQASEYLSRAKDKQVGLRWPIPVDARLDGLLRRAQEAGERTNRREVVAALVATTDLSGEELGEIIKAYRRMKVKDAMLRPSGAQVIQIAVAKPGPRPIG